MASLLSLPTANAALVAAGSGLVYDTDLNITWAQDANLFRTQVAANPNLVNQIIALTPRILDGYWGRYTLTARDFKTASGDMSWFGAKAWINYLNSGSGYLGFTDWRLPEVPAAQAEATGYNLAESELGHLFYQELGGQATKSITITHNTNYALFRNVQDNRYWTGTERSPGATAVSFSAIGLQESGIQKPFGEFSAWAVRPGPVPIPAAAWLLASGFAGLLSMARKRRAA